MEEGGGLLWISTNCGKVVNASDTTVGCGDLIFTVVTLMIEVDL